MTGTDDLRNALRFRCVRRALVLRLAGALASAVPDGVAAMAGRPRRRATAVVTGGPVSTIDVKTRTKHPSDIAGVPAAAGVAVTPDGKTAFVGLRNSDMVSTINVKTRTTHPTDITVGTARGAVAVTPCR